MGTEVLRPHDCLIQQVPSFRKPNPNPTSKKRREVSPRPKNHLVMGQVNILKRGEFLNKKDEEEEKKPVLSDPPLFGRDPLGPDPIMVLKQIRVVTSGRVGDMYAGSAFSMSPSPRKLPLPSFPKRKEESATKDLRRLLRLD